MSNAPTISLDQWRALITVVDAGGYAQAAEVLHKSQSAVTYAVQKIESQLELKAFEIQGRKAILTPTGQMLYRRALALVGEPGLVLDLPCGAGRFWPLLAEKPNRVIIGADNSESMLKIATQAQPADVVKRVQTLHTSAFDIALPDNAVDSIFCMRLLHHIGEAEHRLTILREFERVTRDSVILSLWVDGNFKAWKRKRAEKNRRQEGYQNRFVLQIGRASCRERVSSPV